jgi:hypothetical protein
MLSVGVSVSCTMMDPACQSYGQPYSALAEVYYLAPQIVFCIVDTEKDTPEQASATLASQIVAHVLPRSPEE